MPVKTPKKVVARMEAKKKEVALAKHKTAATRRLAEGKNKRIAKMSPVMKANYDRAVAKKKKK